MGTASRRRGAVLLVVMILLALFTLACVALVVAATHARRNALAAAHIEQTDDPPSNLVNRVFRQVVRGPRNPKSVIGAHSLLEDLYGAGDAVRGRIATTVIIDPITRTPQPADPVNGFVAGDARYSFAQGMMFYVDVNAFGPDRQPGIAGVDDDNNGMVDDASEYGNPRSDDLSPTSGYYNGRVWTMVDGPLANRSTRITGYLVNLNQPPQDFSPPLPQYMARFRLLPLEGMRIDPNTGGWDPARAPRPGDRFVINGRPFNGFGFGYNLTSGALDAVDIIRTPLLPNFPTITAPFGLLPNQTTPTYRTYSRVHGIHADEDYDAPDYQNMMLAGREWNTTLNRWEVPLPSLHRPDLVNYWMSEATKYGWTPTQGYPASQFNTLPYELQRRIVLRPLDVEHFQDVDGNGLFDAGVDIPFAGRDFDPINGPWDVDNDGDGVPDSIWVDVGFGVMRTRDGRLYKPLAAILCLDLDGRLNLNAHGHANQYLLDPAAPAPTTLPTSAQYITGKPPRQVPAYAGGMFNNPNVRLPYGLGSGPADVNLAALLMPPYIDSTSGLTVNEYQRLLEGGPSLRPNTPGFVPGRYGEVHLLAAGRQPRAGITSTGTPISPGPDGIPGTSDDQFSGDDNRPAAWMRFLTGASPEQFEGNLYAEGFFPLLPLGFKGTPGDMGGTGSIALDLRGQPYWEDADYYGTPVNPRPGTLQHAVDDPYEIDLTLAHRNRADLGPDGVPGTGDETAGAAQAADSPFTPAELEYLLRRGDRDALSLPSRIEDLAPMLVADPRRRGLVTTESWDLPCPAITPTLELRQLLWSNGIPPVNLHVTDLVRARLIAGGFQGDINAELAKLLSPELVAGLRMNLNRPFGNGIDDNGNGVVDEPSELTTGQPLWQNGAYGAIAFDANNDGLLDANDILARHMLARHLFVLLMALKDSGYQLPLIDQNLSGNTPEARELTARRIAQWCVNVVDFMDRDSIMTPFEYDVNPFNGWTVDGIVGINPAGPDGILGTADDDPNYTDDSTLTNPDRRLVWGLEYPDLLLTETVAWHDRHVRDLKFTESANGQSNQLRDENNDGNPDDDDLDQYRVPEGVALFELYCTRNPNNPALIGDLYDQQGRLDLGRQAPDGRPVWRLAISRSRFSNLRNDVATRCVQSPDIVSLQPDHFSLLGPLGPQAQREPVEIERFVWLAPTAPAQGAPEDGRTYYNRTGPVTLGPGEYCVIGPRPVMQIGWSDQNQGEPPPQRVELAPMNVTANAPTVPYIYPQFGTEIKPPITMVAAADIPPAQQQNHDPAFQQVGVSVSEPLPGAYYPVPPGSVLQAPGTLRADCFFDVDPVTNQVPPTSNPNAPVLDRPFDTLANMPLQELLDNGFMGTGTVLQYKTVFLQRLADPTLPWNPEPFNWDGTPNVNYNPSLPVNPYLTIDWMPIDLTVFNGDDQRPANTMLPQWDPHDPAQEQNPREDPANPIRFATRQRGFPRTPAAGSAYSVWQQPAFQALAAASDPTTPPRLNVVGQDDFTNPTQPTWNFEHNLAQTLGYINRPFQELNFAQAPNERWYTQAYINNPNNQPLYPNGYDANYLGDPVRPYPWLTWNNRPFLSPMELLLVPTSAPARLQHELGMRIQSFSDHYADMQPGGAAGAPFSHLLNFFLSDANANTPDANFYRLLEFVHVPSRYSGTEELLNPALLQGTAAGPHEYHPPYNRISRYREPGKINLNTIAASDDSIWRAVMNMRQNYTVDPAWSGPQFWAMVAGARVGAAGGPSLLGNPFRSFGNTYQVPPGGFTAARPVEGTFMRASPSDGQRPLFAADNTLVLPQQNDPYPLAARQYDSNNSDRNPYFRYEPFFKLGNVATTRSNVYAIWITVGFFEVERVPVTDPNNILPDVPHYPDGYRLIRELGSDTGEIKRHRGFYIFDRSIPVGFVRGEDLNVERAVLIERILE